jgi:hypothetical protein
MNTRELKLDHGKIEAYRAPTIDEMEAQAKESGFSKFCDVEVTWLYTVTDKPEREVYSYTVCGNHVTRNVAARAFS